MRLQQVRRPFADDASVRRRRVREELRLGRGGLDGELLFRAWSGRTDTGGEESGIGRAALGERVDDLSEQREQSDL